MSDLIDRQQAIDAFDTEGNELIVAGKENADAVEKYLKTVMERIEQLPSAEPKRGRWIHHPEIGWGETWLCDQCGEKTTSTVMGKPRANFCPNCGADMRTKETDCDYERAVEQLEHDMLYEHTFNQDDGSM